LLECTISSKAKTGIPLFSVAGTLDKLLKTSFVKREVNKNGQKFKYLYSATEPMN
jgi:hypothetical protein